MRREEEEEIEVVIDTREQRPYVFPRARVATLKTGDYSIVGFEDRIAIERKSLEDLFGSLGGGRERFEREFERMAGLEYAALVVESSLPRILEGAPHSPRMSPIAVAATLASWSIRYGVHVWLASDRPHGNAITLRLLKFWMAQERKKESCRTQKI